MNSLRFKKERDRDRALFDLPPKESASFGKPRPRARSSLLGDPRGRTAGVFLFSLPFRSCRPAQVWPPIPEAAGSHRDPFDAVECHLRFRQ